MVFAPVGRARSYAGCVKGFASDNYSGAHPKVLAAVAAANDLHAVAYGADPGPREPSSCYGSTSVSRPGRTWCGTALAPT